MNCDYTGHWEPNFTGPIEISWTRQDHAPNHDQQIVPKLEQEDAAKTTTPGEKPVMKNGTFPWLQGVYEFVVGGKSDRAMDVLFRGFEETARVSMDRCGDLIRRIEVDKLDTTLLVGLLSVTRPRAAELPYRATMVSAVESRLRRLAPERADRLMRGFR